MTRRQLFLWALAVVWLLAAGAQARTYEAAHDPGLYGHLNQRLVPVIGPCACAPVSATNSFVYLQNNKKYPGIYGNKLVPDPNDTSSLVTVASTLGDSQHMNTTCPGGTGPSRMAYGKWKYIEDEAPGRTVYSAQSTWGWTVPDKPRPDWFQTNTKPTMRFLYEQLRRCEDVEIQFGWYDPSDLTERRGGHYVTLYAFSFDDTSDNWQLDPSEAASLNFIDPDPDPAADPNTTPAENMSATLYMHDGFVFLRHPGGLHGRIEFAVSESPIPEPVTMLGVLLAAGALAQYLRTRGRKAGRSAL